MCVRVQPRRAVSYAYRVHGSKARPRGLVDSRDTCTVLCVRGMRSCGRSLTSPSAERSNLQNVNRHTLVVCLSDCPKSRGASWIHAHSMVRIPHRPSFSQCVFSTAMPLLSARICFVDMVVIPIARACSLPSAMMATTASAGTSSIFPPGEVNPGAMMLAPESTKEMAPRST